jgi:hypothetical protein
MCPVSHVTCHISGVTGQVSNVTCHVSCVMCNVSCVRCIYFLDKLLDLVVEGLLSPGPIPSTFSPAGVNHDPIDQEG